ncbi:MAG: hypothetical protein LBT30_03595 [Clostridiales bacterium]|jgi:ABC-2 type transport system permease protein|nr:hypothetical protein [Clostridiales bacterium]
MSSFLKLIRILLINVYRIDKEQKKTRLAMYILMAVVFVPILAGVCVFCFAAGKEIADKGLGVSADFLSMIFGAVVLIVFFFGLTAMLQVIFFSKDAEFLMSLPYSNVKLFLAKMSVVYISELLTSFVIILPLMIAFGAGSAAGGLGVSALYYIMIPFAIILLPLIPLLLIALLSFPLMYIVNFFKNKSIMSLIGIMLLFVGFFAVYFLGITALTGSASASEGTELDPEFFSKLVIDFCTPARYFYPVKFLSLFLLLQNPLVNILFFVLSTAVLVGGAVFAAAKLYAKNITSQLESQSAASKTGIKYGTKSSSLERSLFIKEIKLLTRNTGTAFQSYLGMIMCPIILVFYSQTFSGLTQENAQASVLMCFAMAMFLVPMMICGLNYTAHIAFTREGKYFYMNKYLPVPYKLVFKVKTVFATIIAGIGIVLSAITLAVMSFSISGNAAAAFVNALLMCGASGIIAYSLNKLGIRRDLKRPKLNWNNIREALQNNTYVMLPMLISSAGGIFLMIVGIILSALAGSGYLNIYIAYAAFWGTSYLVAVLIYVIFGMKKEEMSDELFERIEC